MDRNACKCQACKARTDRDWQAIVDRLELELRISDELESLGEWPETSTLVERIGAYSYGKAER